MKINNYIMIEEAAKMLGVTSNTLRNWERTGKLKCYIHPINKYRLFKREELEKLLKDIHESKNN
jgi:excisionase family DNA binding protein